MNRKPFLSIQLAIDSFKKTKKRTALTVFGVMVGIAMVIMVFSAGRGIKSLILAEISSFGDNWINIEVKVPSAGKTSQNNASALAQGVSITTLVDEDREALIELDNVIDAYSGVTTQAVFSYRQETEWPTIFAVSETYDEITEVEVVNGRFFTKQENATRAQVLVLGSEIAKNLFGNQDPIGERVKVNGNSYTVIGVMEDLGTSGFMNMDMTVYMPLETVQKKLMGIDHVLWIIASIEDNAKAEATAEEIRFVMRQRHEISDPEKDDFAVTTMNEALSIVGTIVTGITGLLVVLAMIALLVGGVGIMNVMYVSVAERSFEIGLRKSVGATNSQILWQFLMEAVFITFLGAVEGIVIGVLFSYVIAVIANSLGFPWEFSISAFSLLLSVGFSVLVGVFFGIYPAKKAASLDPIAALRGE